MKTYLSTDSSFPHIPFVYFHGKLEDKLDIDLVHVESGGLKMGINLVYVKSESGEVYDALAFIYPDNTSRKLFNGGFRGLIVSPDDISGIDDALEAYKIESSNL